MGHALRENRRNAAEWGDDGRARLARTTNPRRYVPPAVERVVQGDQLPDANGACCNLATRPGYTGRKRNSKAQANAPAGAAVPIGGSLAHFAQADRVSSSAAER